MNMGETTVTIPWKIEKQLDEYRRFRRSETGKVMTRQTAVVELILASLTDFQPARPVEQRLDEITQRLSRLERAVF